MDYQYDENVHQRLARRRRLRMFVWALSITVVLVVIYVIFDAIRTKTVVQESQGSVTQTLGELVEQEVFDEKLFSFTTDLGWQKVDPPERIKQYTDLTYRNLENGETRQELYIVMNDRIPNDYELTYVLPVEVINQNTLQPFDISPKCNQLVRDPLSRVSQIVSWAGVEFMCDPDRGSYIIGTSHNEFGYGTRLAGTNSVNQYFFIFIDYQPVPQFNTFQTILRSFRTK